MIFFLDTNICIEYLKRPTPIIVKNFQQQPCEKIKIPAVVRYELLYGAHKSKNKQALETVEKFLSAFESIPFCDESADCCAKIRVQLEASGVAMGMLDTMIAATVLVHQGTLVTNNTKEFIRVEGLKLLDWTKE